MDNCQKVIESKKPLRIIKMYLAQINIIYPSIINICVKYVVFGKPL